MPLNLSTRITQIDTHIAEIDAAISRAIKARQYSQGDTSVSRQELDKLIDAKASLINERNHLEAANAGNNSGASQGAFQ